MNKLSTFTLCCLILAMLASQGATDDVGPDYYEIIDPASDVLEIKAPEYILSEQETVNSSGNETKVDHRRPVWNIAHMVNSIAEVDGYLRSGANSLEFDVTFTSAGKVEYTYHGIPCDCFRNCLRYQRFRWYIENLRFLTSPGAERYNENLVLLMLDLKLNKLNNPTMFTAGVDVAEQMLEHYWEYGNSTARAYVILSMPSIKQINFIRGFKSALAAANLSHYEDKIGYDFSKNEEVDEIAHDLNAAGIYEHIWQGDGITNCLPRSATRLKECLRRRDNYTLNTRDTNYMCKVYWWTVDKESTIKRTLSLGVDALITNYPDRFMKVLKDPEIQSIARIATIDDNPFVRHPPSSMSNVMFYEQLLAIDATEPEELLYNS